MLDLKRVSLAAVVMLVVLRMAIGWQFLYEGVWKLDTQDSAQPWTAAGYLKNARGPLRHVFRDLSGDPDELQWTDYDYMANRWDEWQNRFVSHYNLSDRQGRSLDTTLNGREQYAAELEQLPEGVEFRGSLGRALDYDPERKLLIVPGEWHMLPEERDRALSLVTAVPEDEIEGLSEDQRQQNQIALDYQQAVRDVYRSQRWLGFKKQLAATVKGDPQWIGPSYPDEEGNIVEHQTGDIEWYRHQLEHYERNLAHAEQKFEHEHLAKQWTELQELRNRVVGPVKALEADLKDTARRSLTLTQLARGPVPEPFGSQMFIDWATMIGLAVLGILLIAGLCSRVAAFLGACLLFSFYLAMPPWPGIVEFQALPGPDHSYIVDKNLIEVFALLAIAFLPTGSWFGLDAFFTGWRARWRAAKLKTTTRSTSPAGARKPADRPAPAEAEPTTTSAVS